MREWLRSVRASLDTINHSIFSDPGAGYIAFTVDRVLLIFFAFLMVRRVFQAGRAIIPRPLVLSNIWYWLRWWGLLVFARDSALKIGGLIIAFCLTIQVLIGSTGSFTVLTWYLLIQHIGTALVFFGVAQWAARLRREAKEVLHES